jgi:ABC-type nickel/cobalt efflux system permease component RcnA
MDNDSYVAFLVIGTVLVLIDGQIIYRNGRRYLQQATPTASAESLTRLVSVLFHLVTLGVLALLSTIDFTTDNPTKGVVLRLGIILLVLGVAHWVAVSALARIRDREEYEQVNHQREAARAQANDAAMRAQGTYVQEPTENPAYTGESATAIVNRQQNQQHP